MKRSGPPIRKTPLRARSQLRQKTPLQSKPPGRSSGPLRPSKPPSRGLAQKRKARPLEPGEAAWKERRSGHCENCERLAPRLERHHVIELKHCKAEGLPLYDLENSMLLCSRCHSRHTSAMERISRLHLPVVAVAFGERMLGWERFGLYLARYYGP